MRYKILLGLLIGIFGIYLAVVWIEHSIQLCDGTGRVADPRPTGLVSLEFIKTWNEFNTIPENQKKARLAEPEFNWNEDSLKCFSVSDSEISNTKMKDWIWSRSKYVSEGNQVPVGGDTIKFLRSTAEVFDTQPYQFNEALKKEISGAPNLRWLRITQKVNAEDLNWICQMSYLRGVDLRDAELEDAELGSLNNLVNLKWLAINTSSKLNSSLPSLTGLEVLAMTGAGVEERHVPQLGQFPNLNCCSFRSSKISDNGVNQVVNACPQLVTLDLGWCTEVSCLSVCSMGRLKQLRYLDLNHTPIESALCQFDTVPELQIMLPGCHIRCGER